MTDIFQPEPTLQPSGVVLSGRSLIRANLAGRNLRQAELHGADFTDAHMEGADLSGADLSGCTLSGTNLEGITAKGACFAYADLRYAFVRGGDLSAANLTAANLTDADFTGADLSGAELGMVTCGTGTIWPQNFRGGLDAAAKHLPDMPATFHAVVGRRLDALAMVREAGRQLEVLDMAELASEIAIESAGPLIEWIEAVLKAHLWI